MVAAAAAAATSSSATSTSNLCHARTSHLANMGLCRHGPQQRRLDLARPPIMIRTARPSRPSQAGPAAGPGVRLLAPGAGAGTGLPRRTMPGLLSRLLQSS